MENGDNEIEKDKNYFGEERDPTDFTKTNEVQEKDTARQNDKDENEDMNASTRRLFKADSFASKAERKAREEELAKLIQPNFCYINWYAFVVGMASF